MVQVRILISTFIALLLVSCASATLEQNVDRIIAAHPGKTIAVAYFEFGPSPGASRHPLPAARGEGHSKRVRPESPSPRLRGEGAPERAQRVEGADEGLLLRNEHEVFHAASTMKVPVMLGIFEAVTRGELRLDQPVRVKNDFVSIFDGSHYALEAREDSDSSLYDRIGQDVPLEELVRRMIVKSSNLATNIVIEFIGAPKVMALMKEIGAFNIRVLRGVEDDKAYHAGMNNTTTAYDLMLIFRALGERRVISAEASQRMIEILLAQEHNDGIPAGLPRGTRVAHKTGWITGITHDAGLVFRPDGTSYVLVVLTRGFTRENEAHRVMARIARATW